MAFHDIRFPTALSFGASGGPERRTEIVTLANGFEERNTPWSQSRRRYDAGTGLRSLDDVEALIAFFEARMGQLNGFRWKDWTDHKSCTPSRTVGPEDQVLGLGDAATKAFQTVKTYRSGAQASVRTIAKIVPGTFRLAIAGDPKVEGVDFTLDATTGLVTFPTPPGVGALITAGYEFDVPVRFDTDRLQASVATFRAGEVPSVPVVELRV